MQLIKQLSGPGAAGVGVLGLAISGTVWNFYGVQLGLSGTVASLLALSVGLFLLRPLPLEPEAPTDAITQPDEATTTEMAAVADATNATSEPTSVLTTAEAIALELAAEAEKHGAAGELCARAPAGRQEPAQPQTPARTVIAALSHHDQRTVQELDGVATAPLPRQPTRLASVGHLFYRPCPLITASTSP